MSKIIVLTDANFQREVFESESPVLVDFWASWCPPCKMMEPVIEALAEEYDTKVRVGKLNVDQNPNMMQRFSITGVPTLMIFKSGKKIKETVGAQSKEQLKQIIEDVIDKG